MQNNYQGYSVFNPLPQRQPEPENFITSIKRKFERMNKNILIGVLIVIAAGFVVGGFITIKNRNGGQVEGALTEASPTDDPGIGISTSSPIPTDTPVDIPTDVSTDQPINTPTDTAAEGAAPTTAPTDTPIPTASPTPTATPTPSPSPTATPNYAATITSVSPQSVSADGSSTSTIIVNVTNNGSSDCGETVSLISNPIGVNFNQSSQCSSGNTTFTATSSTAQNYTLTAQVYGVSYGTNTILFTTPTPTSSPTSTPTSTPTPTPTPTTP